MYNKKVINKNLKTIIMKNLIEMKSRLSYMIEDFKELHSEGAHELADSMQPNIDKLKSDIRELEAHQQVLDLFAVSGWLEFEGNESIFNEYAKRNCLCRFDDGTECRYEDEHPMAILTHFRCK